MDPTPCNLDTPFPPKELGKGNPFKKPLDQLASRSLCNLAHCSKKLCHAGFFEKRKTRFLVSNTLFSLSLQPRGYASLPWNSGGGAYPASTKYPQTKVKTSS
jgi:hypothetical protein